VTGFRDIAFFFKIISCFHPQSGSQTTEDPLPPPPALAAPIAVDAIFSGKEKNNKRRERNVEDENDDVTGYQILFIGVGG